MLSKLFAKLKDISVPKLCIRESDLKLRLNIPMLKSVRTG